MPAVLFVPALHVWQAAQWSVKRPGWAAQLERRGEQPVLRAADVVACGTDIVAEEVLRLGVRPERILITPTGVDLDRFDPPPDGEGVRNDLGLRGKFVIGWVGSFRPFHVLEQLVAAAPRRPGPCCCSSAMDPSGLGSSTSSTPRPACEAVFTGTVSHADLPRHLAAMDVGVVMADPRSFHYSPLKVAEYLAAGLPVVAPDVAPLASRLDRDANAVLYAPGDVDALRAALEGLVSDESTARTTAGRRPGRRPRVVVGRTGSPRPRRGCLDAQIALNRRFCRSTRP